MGYIKKFNEAKSDLSVDQVDRIILNNFTELTDNGFTIEVLHQNGRSTYQIYDPEMFLYGIAHDFFNGEPIYIEDENVIYEKTFENIEKRLKTLTLINNELPSIRERLIDEKTNIEEFKLYPSARIEISVNHLNQGYKNLGSKILIGEDKNRVYRH